MDSATLYDKIKSFVYNDNDNEYKSIGKIHNFLQLSLGCKHCFGIDYKGKPHQYYTKPHDLVYTFNRVLIYFPNDAVRVDLSYNMAKRMSLVRNILDNNSPFQNHCSKLMYKDGESGEVIDGPYIIILQTPIDSIIVDKLPNGHEDTLYNIICRAV
tara:strand:+ start:266 stop:733 length:468 start_codon:yes stop_codon:yes gene_type:complete